MENEPVSTGEEDAKSAAEKQKGNKKERAHRTKQLNLVRAAMEKLDKATQETRKKNKRREALLSHLKAFYSEMNNIAKGKGMSLIPVAELMVTQINDAIADAKQIIEGDVYLDRVKPFISAGNPPSYPEVLLITRTVEEVLIRHDREFDLRLGAIRRRHQEAATVEAGLECAIEDIEYAVSIEEIEERLDGDPDQRWVTTDDEGNEQFDLGRLDALDIIAHFAESDEGPAGGEEHEDDEAEEDGHEDDEAEEDEHDE